MAKKKRKQKIKKEKPKKKIKKSAKGRPVSRSSKPKPLKKKKVVAKPKTRKKVMAKPKTRKKVMAKPKTRKKVMAKPKTRKRIKPRRKVKPPVSDPTIHKTKIRVIGIGGGGGSIVSEIVSRIKRADFVVANTDARALRGIKKVKRFQFGQDLTHGLGTGMNTEVGELAAQNEKERIEKLFEGQDLCIIVICLGGGTGSGAGPIFAKISKKLNCLTYGIFTMPFRFEGEKKMEIARESLEKIKSHLNIFSIIPNERIFQIIDKDTPLKDALSAINERLAENLEGLIEMIYLPGLINIDFADLQTILSGRGRLAYLNTIKIEEPKKEEAVKKVISTPLYSYTIKGARGILYNVVGGKTLQLSEVSQISKIISDSVNKNAKIIFGISQIPRYQDKIKITLLATGCGTKGVLLKPPQAPKPRVPIVRKPQIALPSASPQRRRGESQGEPVALLTTKKVKKEKKKTKKIIRKKPQSLKKKKKPEPKPEPTPSSDRVPGPRVIKSSRMTQRPDSMTGQTHKSKPKPQPVADQPSAGKSHPQPTADQPKAGNPKPKKKPKVSTSSPRPSREKIKSVQSLTEERSEQKIRRNGLQLKKVIEEEEKELLEQEKVWETPAILRRKSDH